MSIINKLYPGGTLARLFRYIIKRDMTLLYPHEISINKRDKNIYDCEEENLIIENICTNSIIIELFKEMKTFGEDVSVFLHGSWADNTNNSFSDIDDFIIIDESKFCSSRLKKLIKTLNRIDMKMCRIDPLQHHGHWIVSKQELLNYDNSYIPLFVLKESKLLTGFSVIKSRINNDITKEGVRRNITNMISSVRKSGNLLLEGTINYYQFKAFISSISLIPPLLFQYNNIEITKKNAIHRANELFTNEALCMILWASEIRKNWHIIDNVISYKIFKKLSYLFFNPFLWRKYSYSYSPKISKNIVDNMSDYQFIKALLNLFIYECEVIVKK